MIKNLKPQRLLSTQTNCHPTVLLNFTTEQLSNDNIHTLCKNRLFKQALQAFNHIITNTQFRIRPSTYAQLISACSSLRSLEHAKEVHGNLIQSGTQPDTILQNHILNMYGKCGSLEDARKVFDGMRERNVVSWASMINGYSQNCREKDAIELYFQMRRLGFLPDQFTYGSLIRVCSGLNDVELGKQVHADLIKSEFVLELIPQNALTAMYTKFNLIDNAWVVFDHIVNKDLISWGSIIGGFAQQGLELEALHLFKKMFSFGFYYPNEFVFGSVFSACSSLLESEYGRQIHGMSVKFGVGRNRYAVCALCDMYAKCGNLGSARPAFYQIEMPDLVSWNAIIAGFAYSGSGIADEAMSFFSQMRHSGLTPDEISIRCLLCAFTSSSALSQGQQVHSYIIKMGFNNNVPLCNTLLTMYTNCSGLSDAFHIFEDMKNNVDAVSWNAILTACLRGNHANEVCRLFKLVHISHCKPDRITLTNVLGACSILVSLELGSQAHVYVVKTGLEADTSVTNGLIDMYTKCGDIVNAWKLFKSMSNPDVVSWSSLIVGYAQFGYGEEALKLFETMRNLGVKPNHVTFVGVLSACSHVGLVEDGYRYYKSMENDYGIVPTREHCSCVVDMLSRAGRLREAEKFINHMPFNPDIVVWKTLLAACRTCGNVEIGKHAAESILKLDPSNSAAHVLLCNIYALTGSWEDVARVRKSMRSIGVMKAPGQSWIELRDGVHVFSVGDISHPQMDEIYSVLGDLWLKMMQAGFKKGRPSAQGSHQGGVWGGSDVHGLTPRLCGVMEDGYID